jgi:uncharacterized integral membrane protein
MHDLFDRTSVRAHDRPKWPVGRIAKGEQKRALEVVGVAEDSPCGILVFNSSVAAPDAEVGGDDGHLQDRLSGIEPVIEGQPQIVQIGQRNKDGDCGCRGCDVGCALPYGGELDQLCAVGDDNELAFLVIRRGGCSPARFADAVEICSVDRTVLVLAHVPTGPYGIPCLHDNETNEGGTSRYLNASLNLDRLAVIDCAHDVRVEIPRSASFQVGVTVGMGRVHVRRITFFRRRVVHSWSATERTKETSMSSQSPPDDEQHREAMDTGAVPALPDSAPVSAGESGGHVDDVHHLPAAHTRLSGSWAAVVVGLLVLLVLIIFILENGQEVKVSFFGAHTRLPEGVALLLAAVIGGLLVVFAGTARILQLRSRSRRNSKNGSTRRTRRRASAASR